MLFEWENKANKTTSNSKLFSTPSQFHQPCHNNSCDDHQEPNNKKINETAKPEYKICFGFKNQIKITIQVTSPMVPRLKFQATPYIKKGRDRSLAHINRYEISIDAKIANYFTDFLACMLYSWLFFNRK